MIDLLGPYALASILVGLGVAAVVIRRNAVLLLVGVELILSGSLVFIASTGVHAESAWAASSVMPLFVITLAAAEVVVALAVILVAFRQRGSIDLDQEIGLDQESGLDAERSLDQKRGLDEADASEVGR